MTYFGDFAQVYKENEDEHSSFSLHQNFFLLPLKIRKKMAFTKLFVLTLVIAVNLQEISGHGMMWDPINRSSAWRKGFPIEPNFTDNEHFCGGFGVCRRL